MSMVITRGPCFLWINELTGRDGLLAAAGAQWVVWWQKRRCQSSPGSVHGVGCLRGVSGKGQLGTMWFWWEPPPLSLLPQQGGEIWGQLLGMQRELGWAPGPFWCSHLALRCPGGGPAGLGEAAPFAPAGVTVPLLLQRLK